METRPALLVRTKRVTPRDEQIMARIIPWNYVVRDFVKTGWGMAGSSLCMLALGDGRLRSQASTFSYNGGHNMYTALLLEYLVCLISIFTLVLFYRQVQDDIHVSCSRK